MESKGGILWMLLVMRTEEEEKEEAVFAGGAGFGSPSLPRTR